ncbi:CBO2463/CBO2479 domain-containing protein [Sporolactobacillus sp. Y61]|uniref:CBO2463/CBO2479 domain-containing protein n=1 Tax=Sporolactobacillus sp. Y61 TaxID=3160863 RepID=A0AAU8IGQ7_9BACL
MNYELTPTLLPGKIIEVTDLGVKVTLKGRMGIIQVPMRCVITDKQLQVGQTIQVYLSYIQVL